MGVRVSPGVARGKVVVAVGGGQVAGAWVAAVVIVAAVVVGVVVIPGYHGDDLGFPDGLNEWWNAVAKR